MGPTESGARNAMRLLLLPISTRRTLIYCEPLTSSAPVGEQSYLDRGVAYAGKTWADWEKSDTKWKSKLTEYGNKMLRRIPFEEWGLKSIPPLKAKQLAHLQSLLRDRNAPVNSKEIRERMVEVKYPGSYQSLTKESVTQVLQRLGMERQSLHKQRLYGSVIAMPFTIPFLFIPVIPNLPFLYLLYRAFSHWRALTGSQHLEFLVKNSLLTTTPSATLDNLYTIGLLHPSREASRKAAEPTEKQTKQVVDVIRKQLEGTGTKGDVDPPYISKAPPTTDLNGKKQGGLDGIQESETEEILLLSGWNGQLLAEALKLPGLEIEIDRAVEQVEKSMRKGKDVKEEKESLEKTTTNQPQKIDTANEKR